MPKQFFMSAGIAAAVGMSALFASTTMAEEREIEFDDSGHGAVLCIAMINASLKAYADTCEPEGGEEISVALGESLADIAKFSGQNGDRSEAEYTTFINSYYEREMAEAREKGKEYCSSSAATEFYAPMAKAKVEDIRKATAKMLSVPRKPLMNPCL